MLCPTLVAGLKRLQLYKGEVKGRGGFLNGLWKVSKRLQAEDLSIGIDSTGKLSPAGKLLLTFNLEKCTK